MRILFLTSQFPYPPQSGGALRAHGLIQGTRAAGHEVELFSFINKPLTETPLHAELGNILTVQAPQRSMQDRLRDLVLTQRADMARRFWSDEALEVLRKRLSQGDIDIVHAESIEMTTYFPALKQAYPDIPLIYGSLNAEADLQRSIFKTEIKNWYKPRGLVGAIYSWLQWRRLTRFEGQICGLSAHVLAVSEPDQVLLAQLSKTPITVVKNGIPVSDYLPIEPTDELGAKALVFTGTMDYRPNIDAVLWFAEEIFPQVLTEHPDAHFYVVGNRPHPRLDSLREHPNITITGRVEDMEPYWRGATIYIAPLRMGSGTRFKLLGAMAAQCAIVSTTIGAMGLGVTSGQEMRLADKASDFAQAVNDLLSHPAQREQMRQTGREFVQTHFDWSVIVPHLLEVYDSLR